MTTKPKADDKAANAGQAEGENKQAAPEYVTRSELTEVVTAAVNAAVPAAVEAAMKSISATPAAATETEVTRKDGKGEKEPTASESSLEQVVRSMTEMVKTAVSPMTEAVATMNKRLDKLEGQTVARSDNDDAKQAPAKKGDVFTGIFGNRSKDAA